MPAAQCSTGEQKALLIGLILAQARAVKAVARAPLLCFCLDEVAAHLDGSAGTGFFETLEALGAQAWMTGTDRPSVRRAWQRSAQFFHVEAGTLAEMQEMTDATR